MNSVMYLIPVIGIVALLIAYAISVWINKNDEGTDRMKEIASYIREGAMTFLMREYRTIVIFTVAVFTLLVVLSFFTELSLYNAFAFLLGAAFSVLAGFCGMRTATKSNVRTAAAAQSGGMVQALKIAFRGGAVMGLCVVGLGVLGIGILLVILGISNAQILTGFGFGASSIALFGRVGGGIYTKAADVGADLVGKMEAGIPEDDPRNPAVIADNVGDNVGDVAGMGSDLFESYVGAIISAVTLAVSLDAMAVIPGVMYPLLVCGVGIIAAIVAIFMVGTKRTKNPSSALNLGTYISSAIVLVASFFASRAFFGDFNAFAAIASGIVVGVAIGALTERFTSSDFKSVKGIAKHAETGAATTIIDGFAVGMISTVAPIILIAVGILVSYYFSGLYGIALAAVGMLSTTGVVVAVDAYGPIADNAGGIAEMSKLPHEVREITDKLDSVGNTTAAVGKGFAIGSAALTALALFVAYAQIAKISAIDLLNPMVVVGLLIGGMLPFLFSALTMKSVGKAAFQMVEEVRRQFREDEGIMLGKSKPNYSRCINISTDAALKEMNLPALLAVISPLAVGLVLGVEALGGLLAGSLVAGVLLAITMSNAGGAWDNAKKYIEEGNHGGKGGEARKAAVVGDTVGDPFKDTSGPSINILIKLMTIVAVVFLPLFLR